MLKYQDLVGAALGPFLAILLSAFAFFIKKIIEKWNSRSEVLRRIEIAVTLSMNDTFVFLEEMNEFLSRLQIILNEIKKVPAMHATYAINDTNFPPVIDIFYDLELQKLKTGSYYLHNKILNSNRFLRWCSVSSSQYRNDFLRLLENNHSIVVQKLLPPIEQRRVYIENLEGFSAILKDFLQSLSRFFKDLAQIKAYNDKLRKFFLFNSWRYEGLSFKFFKTRKEMFEFSQSVKSLDRIDDLLNKDVDRILKDIPKIDLP